MLTKCKCGRNTTFGLTCAFCRSTVSFDDPQIEEAEFPEENFEESGFHIVELDDDYKEYLDAEEDQLSNSPINLLPEYIGSANPGEA